MKILIPALLLLAACGGTPPRPENDSVEWLIIAGSPSFDPPSLKEGEYALYRVTLKADGRQGQVKFRATKRDADGVWIETTYIAMNAKAVIKSKIDAKGERLETWTGVPGSAEAPKQEYLRSKETPPTKPPAAGGPKPETAVEVVTLNGKAYTCTRLFTTFTHDGKAATIKEWCCSEVPFTALHEKRKIGGLVRRDTDRFMMELMGYGVEQGEDLPLPR